MGGVQTSAIKVEAPLARLNKQIQAGRLNFKQLSRVMRNSSGIIAENNALLKAQAVSYIDASGSAKVYMNVVRGTAATQATLTQRLMLGVTALKAFGAQLIATGKNVQWAGRQVMIGLSLPLLALGAAATRGAEEFDKQMTRMVKVTNLAGVGMRDEMGRITQTYQVGSENMKLAIDSIERQADRLAGIGASMGFMANETSKLAAEFSQMGFAGVALDGLSQATLRLSRVSGADLTDAMNLTRLAAMAFGKQIGEGEDSLIQSFSRLNMIENRTSLSLNEMAGAIPIVAGVAKNLGIEIETLGGMLALMKDKGIAAREGATSLRTGLIRLVQDATDPAIEAFEKLNINITELQEANRGNVFGLITDLSHILYDLQNAGEGAAQKTELFIAAIGKMVGTRAAARFTSMLEGLGRDVEMYTDIVNGVEVQQFRFVEGVDESGDAFRAMSPAIMDANVAMRQFLFEEERVNTSLAGTAEILRSELNLELRRFGRQLLPIKNALMEFARDLIRGFNNLSERTRTTVIAFAGMVTVLGPLTMVFGVVLNAVGQLISLFARMLPGLRLTTVAVEAERKAFDANSTTVIQNTTAKQAMIRTNGSLVASANAVTSAVAGQAGAYGALGAAMAASMGRVGAGGSGAVAASRASSASRRIRGAVDPKTGKFVPASGLRLNPVTGKYENITKSGSVGRGFLGGKEPTQTSAAGKRAGGEDIATAAMIAGMTIPQIMAINPRLRFNPSLGMQGSHTEAIRQMLSPQSLMARMPGADVAQLTSKSAGGMSPIQAIHQMAFREATAKYEQAAANAVKQGIKIPSVQQFMNELDIDELARSATLRAGTEGITVTNPRTGAVSTPFPAQPGGLREMTGLGQRMGSRDIVTLNKEQRAMLKSQYGVNIGRRAQIGQIESAIKASKGSTAALYGRMAVEDLVEKGEAAATRTTMTRQDLIAQDRAFAQRQVQSAVAEKRIADTPEARRSFERQITPARALEGKEGARAMRRDVLMRGRETLMGKRAPVTGLEKGIAAGTNAAMLSMLAPFKLIAKAVKTTATSFFGVIPVVKLFGNIIKVTTVPVVTALAQSALALVSAFGALTAASMSLGKGLLANFVGDVKRVGQRGMHNVSELARRGRVSAARTRGKMFPRQFTKAQGPAPFIAGPVTAGARAKSMGGFAQRMGGRAASSAGSAVLGLLSVLPGVGRFAKAGRTAMSAKSAVGPTVKASMRSRFSSALAADPTVAGYREARLRSLALGKGTAAGPILPGQAASASQNATRGQRLRAGLSGLRGAAMAKGGISSFAAGSVLGAAATVAIPIVLTLGAAAISNPESFKKKLFDMFGPTLETIKRLWDGISSAFTRLVDTFRSGGEEIDGLGSKLSGIAGTIAGVLGNVVGLFITPIMAGVRTIIELFNALFLSLKGDSKAAGEALRMAMLTLKTAAIEVFASIFDMLSEIPLIGGAFERIADGLRGWAEESNNSLAALQLIPDAVAEINSGIRNTKRILEENKKEYEDIGKIIKDLVDFEIVDQKEIDRLVDMVSVTENMSDAQAAARADNLDIVYDELVAMEHLTDEQITQIGQYVRRKQIESNLNRLEAEQRNLINALQEVQENGHDHIISQRIKEMRIATLQSQIEAELAKNVEDRDMNQVAAWQREGRALQARNDYRVSEEALQAEIDAITQSIADSEEELLGLSEAVNTEIANRKQRIDIARQATEEEVEQMEELQEAAEEATRFINTLKSTMGETMNDIQGVLQDIISDQTKFIDDYFSSLAEAGKEYFSNFNQMFEDQTDIMLEQVDVRAEAELDMIDQVADAAIAKIEEEIAAEEELERYREDFFRKEKARIDFLKNRRIGEVKIQEEILRGNLAQASIMQIEQQASAEDFYSSVVQERENELKNLRNQAREQRIAEFENEREILKQEVEAEKEATEEIINASREMAQAQSDGSALAADQVFNNAKEAAKKAMDAEAQRVENYLREWSRVTPATEEEFLRHTAALQNFMEESSTRLEKEIAKIDASMRQSLNSIDSEFKNSVNSQSQDLAAMVENSRFALSGIYESVRITSENSLTAMLGMVDGFTNGLSEGFMRGEDLVDRFAEKFEEKIVDAFDEAALVAREIMAEEDKWAAAGERAAQAFNEAYDAIVRDQEERGRRASVNFDPLGYDWAAEKMDFTPGETAANIFGEGFTFGNFKPMGPGDRGAAERYTPFKTTGSNIDPTQSASGFSAAAARMGLMTEADKRSSFVPQRLFGNIPFMAKGGVVDKATIAMIGEAGPEAVIPLKNLAGMINDINSRSFLVPNRNMSISQPNAQNSSNVEYNYELNFNIEGGNVDENKLAQKVVFEIKKMDRSAGGGRRVMT